MITFAGNIYLWRSFKGLTQEELAGKSGIPRPNLSAIESGKREVSLATLRALAIALGVAPGILADGIPPLSFKETVLSRKSLEDIVKTTLSKAKNPLLSKKKDISGMLSGIIKNRFNAAEKKYRNTFKNRQSHVTDWLLLKASVRTEVLNNLLTRLDKHIELGRH